MPFSHVLLTRPEPQSLELAQLLAPLGLETVVQPAFTYEGVEIDAEQPADLAALTSAGPGDLLLFTSPRAVAYGVPQLPAGALARLRLGAVGPATARALNDAGFRVGICAADGYDSEALLETIAGETAPAGDAMAFIAAAPGGRMKLADGLRELGRDVRMLMVYRSAPAPLDRPSLARLSGAAGVLSVWTSGNTMKALSQRLPAAAWFKVCQGEWLVISDRLERLARAYAPERIHRASGPGNEAILAAVRNLC